MTKRIKKGFTLTELIVVIAIIAILAAVLIPTSISFIKKAKISKNEQQASAINTILTAESIFDDVGYYTPQQLEDLLLSLNYSLTSSVNGYAYWYDTSTNRVSFLSYEEAFDVISAANDSSYTGIEAIFGGTLCYIEQSDSVIRNTIDTIRNLVYNSSGDTYDAKIGNMTQNFITSIKNIENNAKSVGLDSNTALIQSIKDNMNKYNPSDGGLYIDETAMYSDFTKVIQGMIFTEGITVIPAPNLTIDQNLKFSKNLYIELPSTVQIVSQGAFENIRLYDNDNEINEKIEIKASPNVYFSGKLSDKVSVSKTNSAISYKDLTSYSLTYKPYITELGVGKKGIYDESINIENMDNNFKGTLIPFITVTSSGSMKFNNLLSLEVRSKIHENVQIFTAIAVDKDLNGYKLSNIGAILDVNSNVSNVYNLGTLSISDIIAYRVRVSDPLCGYDFSNIKDIEVYVQIEGIESEIVLNKIDSSTDVDESYKVAYLNDYYIELNHNTKPLIKKIIVKGKTSISDQSITIFVKNN